MIKQFLDSIACYFSDQREQAPKGQSCQRGQGAEVLNIKMSASSIFLLLIVDLDSNNLEKAVFELQQHHVPCNSDTLASVHVRPRACLARCCSISIAALSAKIFFFSRTLKHLVALSTKNGRGIEQTLKTLWHCLLSQQVGAFSWS